MAFQELPVSGVGCPKSRVWLGNIKGDYPGKPDIVVCACLQAVPGIIITSGTGRGVRNGSAWPSHAGDWEIERLGPGRVKPLTYAIYTCFFLALSLG